MSLEAHVTVNDTGELGHYFPLFETDRRGYSIAPFKFSLQWQIGPWTRFVGRWLGHQRA
ncbi:hypothetical protein NEUTE1DRAFT_118167 [Neurospora tetrasperma FGSC 2508]|uniref:Uncharacterized protein n=1 Tax=Neurospora tetrasperma (strain FGSC 2508 / ATCC MYA-4615 / P0657) TaxID=510951 RepID=F8MXC5_NEUT8|nr:uncharacterized protein NEUTE1DRAFT_118167 [Neurospora tetrasperma FGSC 2508]EGO54396.1 hypothetical protein NEUTE1DRAFT_118167 [Neurospora tetrasperma FGSC 2508]EGZ68160.1 hypothetical protein NEUTE2DRAFT_145866 [Neurospora tetrasperma FGSC 2509]